MPKGRSPYTIQHGLDQVFGLGTRDEHRRRDDEIHAPEFLMPGDVLRGNAAGAFGQRGVIATLLIDAEFALRMRVEIGSVAIESEHHKQLRVHARGGDVFCGQPGDGGGEGWFQLHKCRSPWLSTV